MQTHWFKLSLSRSLLCIFLSLSMLTPAWSARDKKEKLPSYYSEWLNRDVVYIITKQEKKDFLELKTDKDRDAFIQRFWDIRNPTPGSPSNAYKDEIYSRIAYADAHFSIGSGGEGWRSDRGRTYITLGPPQQIEKHYGAANLRPMEIWFYSNTNPSLPPFFNVLFYQRDNIGDYRFYSPSMDGPTELVTGMEAINNPAVALKVIRDSVGSEVARVAQSLIPGEPLDPSGNISLRSDVMLSIIRNLANQPFNVDEINRRRQNIESVISRMILDSQNLDIFMLPVRGLNGLTRLDYAIRLHDPSDLTLAKLPDGQYSYAVEIRVRVFTKDKKLIFTQQKSAAGKLTEERYNEVKHTVFGYEGILPLPPGGYSLEFLLTDWTKKVGFKAEREVSIPAATPGTFVVPGILPFSSAESVNPARDGTIPFALAGVRFTPLQAAPLVMNQLQELKVAYQIWAPPNSESASTQALNVQYAVGQPALVGTPTVIKESVDPSTFTSTGSVVNGKKLSLSGKPDGNYILTVAVSGAQVFERAHASLPFQIIGDVPISLPWDIDEPEIDGDLVNGILDQQRGLCYMAAGDMTEARHWFRAALQKNHSDEIARAQLVQAYYSLNAYSAVAALLDDAGVTSETGSGTIVQIAESLLKTGNPSRAVSLLQNTIHSRPDDGPLYLALADSYRKIGNSADAERMALKGQDLLKNETAPH